jgi:methyltransferase (TIGR00027 family)
MAILIEDVPETAIMVAMWRALETKHPKPLFHDHLAEKLAGERGREIIAGTSKMRAKMGSWMMAVRTRLIDDLIQSAVADGIDVVVNLGAGLDTRPYRLDLPESLIWIEVDYPKIIDLKESRLAAEKPLCQLERIRCDLAVTKTRQELFSSLSGRGKKILVLTEGVIIYLNENDVGALADDLRKHESFRLWIADYFAPSILRYRNKMSVKSGMENAPFLFIPQDYYEFFLNHGWKPKEIHYLGEAAERLKRPPPLILRAWAILRAPFVGRSVRTEMRRAMAYVLFEPGKS